MAAKHVLRYLRGTIEYGLRYTQMDGVKLEGYIDANWACNMVNRKTTFGCCFNLGSRAVYWFKRKQTLVALSFAKAEYMVANLATCEAIWL